MIWMRKAVVLVSALIIFGHLLGPQSVFAQAETYGTMMVVKGDIKVTSAKQGKTDNAKVGFKVYSGDSIVAGPDSRAKIIMSDKNVLNISPDSKVTIAKYENTGTTKNVELKVDYGKVRASVEQQYDGDKSKFNIRTPTAVAGVRGTDFMAGYNPQTRRTQVITFSGVVAVGTAGTNGAITNAVFVRPGQSTSVGDGQKPEVPMVVPKEQIQDMNMDSSADTAAVVSTPDPAGTDKPKAEGTASDAKQTETKPAETKAAVETAAPAPAPEAAPRSPSSIPATTAMPTMVDTRDLNTGDIAKAIQVAPALPKIPTNFKPPQSPVTSPTPSPLIDNVIRKSKVTVTITLPN